MFWVPSAMLPQRAQRMRTRSAAADQRGVAEGGRCDDNEASHARCSCQAHDASIADIRVVPVAGELDELPHNGTDPRWIVRVVQRVSYGSAEVYVQ